MNDNLSETNRKNKWCVHYGFSNDVLIKDYLDSQAKSFNVNDKEGFN